MRKWLLLASTLVFVTGIAGAARQDDKPAEQVFKNIQSFKGQPASAILPAMQFMSASLKVDCDYCHVEDKSSDQKEEKQTARKMIAMTKAINDANFEGRNRVTCATCHAGHPTPLNMPPIIGADLRAKRDNSVEPARVLAAYDKAVGNGEVRTITLEGQDTRDGKTAPFKWVATPKKLYVSEGPMTVGSDGAHMWIKRPDGVFPIPPEVATGFERLYPAFFGSSTLPKLDRPRTGAAKIAGEDVVVLSGPLAGSKDRGALYFDRRTGLLARIDYLQPTILGFIPSVIDFSHYRKVDGLEVPMEISVHSEGGNEKRTFKTVKLNGSVDESIFAMPKK